MHVHTRVWAGLRSHFLAPLVLPGLDAQGRTHCPKVPALPHSQSTEVSRCGEKLGCPRVGSEQEKTALGDTGAEDKLSRS